MLKNMENRAVRSLQVLYIIVLRAEKITTFEPKVVKTSARNAKIYKICKSRTAIFSSFYNISRPNFVILLIQFKMLFVTVVVDFILLA